jgi:hypothetical protein
MQGLCREWQAVSVTVNFLLEGCVGPNEEVEDRRHAPGCADIGKLSAIRARAVFNSSAPVLQNDTCEADCGERTLGGARYRTGADDRALDGANPAANQQKVTVPLWTGRDADHATALAMHPVRDGNAVDSGRLLVQSSVQGGTGIFR